MIVQNIYDVLNELSPFNLQEKWDNAGLLVGSFDQVVQKIYISIDLDDELIESMDENSLIITHHPLIFSGLKKVNFDTYSSKLLKKLIKKRYLLNLNAYKYR